MKNVAAGRGGVEMPAGYVPSGDLADRALRPLPTAAAVIGGGTRSADSGCLPVRGAPTARGPEEAGVRPRFRDTSAGILLLPQRRGRAAGRGHLG